jgi:hypothetical protein
VVGVGLVQLWVDHPVFVRESLYFDYTEAYPRLSFILVIMLGLKETSGRSSRWVFQLATHFMFLWHF